MHKLVGLGVTLILLAGCAQPVLVESCTASRAVFGGLAPGMSALLAQRPLVDLYNVTDLPATVPILPLNVDAPWPGAGIGSIAWTFTPSRGYSNTTGGYVTLAQAPVGPLLVAQFPARLHWEERVAVVVQFFENTTSSDAKARRELAHIAVNRARLDIPERNDGFVMVGIGVTSGTLQYASDETPVALPLQLSPRLAAALRSPDAQNEAPGYRQVMKGQYAMDLHLPQSAARGQLGSAAFEVRTDAHNQTEVVIWSQSDDEAAAARLRDAALALVGFSGNVTWEGTHDEHAPVETWRGVCNRGTLR